MAGAATEIGSLVFRFLGDTKSLDASNKKIDKDLDKLDKDTAKKAENIKKSVAVMTAAFIALGTGIAVGIKKAATEMDHLLEASQRLGIPIEQLSALKYAADLSGSSLEGLSASMRLLNRNLGEVANGAVGDATNAFTALGIKVTDAAGQLRGTTDILLDVAEKFSSFEDGANKSALAMALFGRQGAELIPLLNEGRTGITRMTDEAKRFGLVVSVDAARAADEFNDNIDRLTAIMSGWAIAMANKVLPTLNQWLEKVEYAVSLGKNFWLAFLGTDEKTTKIAGAVAGIASYFERLNVALANSNSQLMGFSAQAAKLNGTGMGLGEAPDIAGQRAAADEELRAQTASMASWKNELSSTLGDGSITAAQKMEVLVASLKRGTIGFREFGDMSKQVSDENKNNMLDLASATASALTQIFGENKAAAIASAIINTAVGVTKAMQLPPPFNFAQAALIAATGAAQIAAIRSTSKGGGGAAPSVGSGSFGGGSSGGGSSGGGSSGDSAPGVQNTLHVSGIGATDLFTGEMVRGLSESILKYQRDGGKVVLDGII
jgi:uncharacterized membrane protein YgcG